MVAEMKHFINGIEIRPVNADSIGIRLDFTGDAEEAELNTDSIVLTNEAYSLVNSHVSTLGLFEGVPYKIQMGTLEIEYFINLTQTAKLSDSEIECQIQKTRATNWFMKRANSTSWEVVNKKTPITGGFDLPYIIVKDNQVELLIMLSISTYSLTRELIQATRDLVDLIAAGASALTPVPTAGDVIAFALKVAAQIVYTSAILIALIKVITQLIELICPKVRYLKANKVKSLLQQGAAHFGYQFSSTLLDEIPQLTLLPVPLVNDNTDIFSVIIGNDTTYFNKPYPSAMDTTPNVGDLFEAVKKWCNGKIRVIGNTVHLERRDYWYNLSSQSIINTLNLQDRRENQNTFNFGEVWKRYYTHYLFDYKDTHTVNKIRGIQSEKSTEPINVVNPEMVTITGLVDIQYQWSLAARKNELNITEKALFDVATLGDSVISFFGGNSSFAATVSGRIGVMQISEQHFTNTKLMFTIGGKQPSNYLDYIGADAVYDRYHFINEVDKNLKEIATASIPFAPKQFENLLNNNVLFDEGGNQLEILTFEYVNAAAEAEIEFSVFSDKGVNTQTITIL